VNFLVFTAILLSRDLDYFPTYICIYPHSIVHTQDTPKHAPKHIPKYIPKYAPDCTVLHTPSLYVAKYPLKMIPRTPPSTLPSTLLRRPEVRSQGPFQYAPDCTRFHTPSKLDCTFQSVLPATLARTLARIFAHECRVSRALRCRDSLSRRRQAPGGVWRSACGV